MKSDRAEEDDVPCIKNQIIEMILFKRFSCHEQRLFSLVVSNLLKLHHEMKKPLRLFPVR